MRFFARLTGLVVLLYGAWMVTINLFEAVTGSNTYEPPWMLLVVLGFGASGAIGGTLFLLSIDGPPRFRTPMIRAIGWVGMFICSALPTSLFYRPADHGRYLRRGSAQADRAGARGTLTQLRVMSLAATRGPKLGSWPRVWRSRVTRPR